MKTRKNKKNKICTVIEAQAMRYFLSYDINKSLLYKGCNRSKWDPDGARYRRDKSFSRKINKAWPGVDHNKGLKRRGDAVRIANKLAKIPEIKLVYITERIVDVD